MKRPTRWLLLAYQLPSGPSNLRVQTWRRLRQLGALPVKQALYVLPDLPSTREDFAWLKAEIDGLGGHAKLFAADGIDGAANDELIDDFRRAREKDYAALERQAKAARRPQPKRSGSERRRALVRLADTFRQRLAAVEAIDFFGAPGRNRVTAQIDALTRQVADASPGPASMPPRIQDKASYAGRIWVTRPHPGVDRMASAWLIRQFIDPKARFTFANELGNLPDRLVPFDMFGATFGHHGGRCTFETLQHLFGLTDPAISRIAAIVHDLDLKDARFGAAEAPTVAALIDGLQGSYRADAALLAQGMKMFGALYTSFANATHTSDRRRAGLRRSRTTKPRR